MKTPNHYQAIYWSNQPLEQAAIEQLINNQFDRYLIVQIDRQSDYQNWMNQNVTNFIIDALKNHHQNYLLVLKDLDLVDYNHFIGDFDAFFDRDQSGFSQHPGLITNHNLYQALSTNQFDPHQFYLPPNLKIIATFCRNQEHQIPNWAFRKWDHLEFMNQKPTKTMIP